MTFKKTTIDEDRLYLIYLNYLKNEFAKIIILNIYLFNLEKTKVRYKRNTKRNTIYDEDAIKKHICQKWSAWFLEIFLSKILRLVSRLISIK